MNRRVPVAMITVIVLLLVSVASGVEVTLLGPTEYLRTKGGPDTYYDTFPGVTGAAMLIVDNGDPSGDHRVSSASVMVNGELVLGPENLNQRVPHVEAAVDISESNAITITIKSKPGSFLSISILQEIPIEIEPGFPGLALESPNRLLVALPVKNIGIATALDVQVTSASLVDAVLLEPPFPEDLGNIEGGKKGIFEAAFTSDALVSGDEYLLTVAGNFMVGGVTVDYSLDLPLLIPDRSPGSAALTFVSAEGVFVTGAPFPGDPGPTDIPEGFNEEDAPPVPTSRPVGDLLPTNEITGFGPATPAASPIAGAPFGGGLKAGPTDPVLFFHSNQYRVSDGAWLDPSGATSDNVVLGSYNGPVAFSTDGGATYWYLSAKNVFPNNDADGNLIDGGFGCDQVIQYIPKIDRFIWLMQFRRGVLPGDDPKKPSGPNRYRLAAASPSQIIASGGTAWTYWDLTSALFGFGNNWMDYPDLAVGDNFLYLSADAVGLGGLFVSRIPLVDIQAGGVIHIGFTDPANGSLAWGAHLVQNVKDTAYWAGHDGTKIIRLFSMPEGDDHYYWTDIGIVDYPNSDYSSIAPNGQNWLGFGFPGAAIIAGTRLSTTHFPPDDPSGEFDLLWLAWTAGRGGGFPQPHVQVVTIDTWDNSVQSQKQLWNSDVAIAYPAMAVNTQSEVGMAVAFGGGSAYSNFAVGIFGEPTFYWPALADASVGRFGDYFGVRRHSPLEGLYAAFGMRYTLIDPELSNLCAICSLDPDMKCGKDEDCAPSKGTCVRNCRTNLHYILFGRRSAIEPPPPPPR